MSARDSERTVGLEHGAGGRAMRELVAALFVDPEPPTTGALAQAGAIGLAALDDGAAIPLGEQFLIVTTDSHVIQPSFFPGGDVGTLAVAGTVNDLAVMGATEVLALTSAIVLEVGFPLSALASIQRSMRQACREAGATIVTGDTKVMGRGELDGIVINTTGIGLTRRPVPDNGLRPGDRIVVSGNLGDHGFAVLAARNALELAGQLVSDVAPINGLVREVLAAAGEAVVAMKDPTRGGLASALHEMAGKSGVGVLLDERALPISAAVRAVAELLGIDPLHVANEGKVVLGVRPDAVPRVLAALHAHPQGRQAAVVGTCVAAPAGAVIVDTGFGRRLLVEPEGEPLPRIC